MKGAFSYDNPFVQLVNKFIDIVCLSLLWIVFSMPLVTIGASSAALSYTVKKVLIRGEGGVCGCFWRSFRRDFRQATTIWLILGILLIPYALGAYFGCVFYEEGAFSPVLLAGIAVSGVLLIGWACWIFPYIARFSNTIKAILSNCLYMFIRHFPVTLLLVLILTASALLAVLVPFGFAIAPAACAWGSSFPLESVFKKYAPVENHEDVHDSEDEQNS